MVSAVNGGRIGGYQIAQDSPGAADQQMQQPLDLFMDFTRPDGQRTRPLLVDGKRLYVDEHYISVWSPVLRSWCIECPDRELILANVQYDHVLELLLAIHPTYKEVDEQTVHILLPLAFDYQMDGLLHRCECFLVANKLPFLEKVWLADRFQLNRLLSLLLRELRPSVHKLDLSGPRYAGLSDRVKVLLLERMHGSPAPEELPEPPMDMEHLLSASDLNFATVKAKTGRAYHVNPYYVAAWSSLFQDRLCNGSSGDGVPNEDDLIYCPCSSEELKYFLMAIYPPQLRVTGGSLLHVLLQQFPRAECNIAPVLMAACKLESQGLLRKCATILLSPHTQLSVFVRLSLLDRCRLQELLAQCLQMVHRPENLVEMSQQQTYECLSIRAKAEMMDRFALLVQQQGGSNWPSSISGQPASSSAAIHLCSRCKTQSACAELTWQCPQCKTYTSPASVETSGRHSVGSSQQKQQQMGNGIGSGGVGRVANR
uniref:BTB domain-containing protein n=1 Tax=Globodera pallida TaxID=36090 RepID=A0A183CDJ3_GLOPA